MRSSTILTNLWVALLLCEGVPALPVKPALHDVARRDFSLDLTAAATEPHHKRGFLKFFLDPPSHPSDEIIPQSVITTVNHEPSTIEYPLYSKVRVLKSNSYGEPTAMMRVNLGQASEIKEVILVVKRGQRMIIFGVLERPTDSYNQPNGSSPLQVKIITPDGRSDGFRQPRGPHTLSEGRKAYAVLRKMDKDKAWSDGIIPREKLDKLEDAMREVWSAYMWETA
ncbi:hypothetical protein FRB96_009575 [Tulasnella sp. 330]|nr:hypothetical protein FRB96_009575 [Tulasnella sp. 330]KAG8872482.1 hypothetical protein FRB97_007579 [Tulasnella sp. 331]